MKRLFVILVAGGMLALGTGCSSTYYQALEKIGYAKRDLLVSRVEKSREAQAAARTQFASALEQFIAVTRTDGGDLQRKYDELNRQYGRSSERAQEVRDRIAAVEDVADALFREWKQELSQYASVPLRAESQHQLDLTRRRYDDLIRAMHRAAGRMEPVLATFHDQVLFLKHNLNARVLASLDTTDRALETDVSGLMADMEASIREADAFIKTMRAGP